MIGIIGEVIGLWFILINITNDLGTYGTREGIIRCFIKSLLIVCIYNFIKGVI